MEKDEFEKKVDRFNRRYSTFMSEGLCSERAYDLASAMYERDADPFDDRRVCFECSRYVGKVCMAMRDKLGKPQMPLRFILQNCDDFQLKATK